MEGLLKISRANSLTWVKRDVLDSDNGRLITNTLTCDEDFANIMTIGWTQKWIPADVIKTQVWSDYAALEVILYRKSDDAVVDTIVPTVKNVYTDFTVYEFSFNMSSYPADAKYYAILTATDGTFDTIIQDSEIFKISTTLPHHNLLEWNNVDNFFDIDYTTGIVHRVRIKSRINEPELGGEETIFDNDGVQTKVKAVVNWIETLTTEAMPKHMFLKLGIAQAHDRFFLNGDLFLSQGKPEKSAIPESNLHELKFSLIENDIAGTNSHDAGICETIINQIMDGVIALQQLAVSGNPQFNITDGYSINQIIVELVSGSAGTFKAGWAAGTDNVTKLKTLTGTGAYILLDRETIGALIGGNVMYFTTTGVGATFNIYVQTIIFKQES